MATDLTSIVIVTHQRPQFFARCLASCANQDFPNKEILVVVNPRDSESEAIALQYGAQIIRTHANIGFFPALNVGIANTSGQRVMVVDDDATFERADALTRMNAYLDANPTCAVVSCNIRGPCEPEPYPFTGLVHVFKTGFALFRREVFSKIAGYVPDTFFRAAGESYLSNYIYEQGYNVAVICDVWMNHAQTATGRSNRAMNHYAIRNHALVSLLQEPLRILPVSLVSKLGSSLLRIAIQRGDYVAWTMGWLSLIGHIPWAISHRKPISWRTFKRIRELRANTGRVEQVVVQQGSSMAEERNDRSSVGAR